MPIIAEAGGKIPQMGIPDTKFLLPLGADEEKAGAHHLFLLSEHKKTEI
ncbi:hypothetical protein HBDW_34090 [Herbaspirillum sp. DW155]|nr:hypothetical protein HBDW_34090 [Herbaspirillum sp. DW155]